MTGARPLLLIAIVAAVIASACGGAGARATGAERTDVTAATVAVTPPAPRAPRIGGGTVQERALLRRIVARLRPTQIRTLTVLPLAAPWQGRPGDVELSVSLISGARDNPLGEWETWIVGGAFHDRSSQLGLPRVRAVVGGAGGSLEDNAPRPMAPAAGLRAFRTRLLAAVRRSGARLAGLRTGQPDGYAAELWVQVTDPAAFLQHRLLRLEGAFAGRAVDGVYLSVFETDGRELFNEGSSNRLSAGLTGMDDPLYQACAPAVYPGEPLILALIPPLPCPSNRRPPLTTPPTRPRLIGWTGERSGRTFGVEFVLQNPNGHAVTVTSIAPDLAPKAGLRLIGVLIRVPSNRSDGTAAQLQRPYGPEPPLRPRSIAPGDWIGVSLHFRITDCAGDRRSSPRHLLTIGYLLEGVAHRATFAGLPLPPGCAG